VACWQSSIRVQTAADSRQHLFDIKNVALTRILMDQGIYVSMLVFAAGLRHLIRQARRASRNGSARCCSVQRWDGWR
jgi:hypothetical protein